MSVQEQQRKIISNSRPEAFGIHNIDDRGEDETTENEEKTVVCPYWDNIDDHNIGVLLKEESRGVTRNEIIKRMKNLEAICLYRFASNCGGNRCNGIVYGGICSHHWQQMGIAFNRINCNVLDNVETGSSRPLVDKLTPYYINVHGTGVHSMGPIVRSLRYADMCKDRDKLASIVSSTYELASTPEEAAAMAKGLLTFVFGQKPEIITIRNSWLDIQKQLARTLDPNHVCEFIQGSGNVKTINIDNLSIYDSPMFLAMPFSSVRHNISDNKVFAVPGTIAMLQWIELSRTIGIFGIVGPIVYAPNIKHGYDNDGSCDRYIKNDPTPRQYWMVPASIAGYTTSTKQTLIPLNLAQSTVYVMNIPENKVFDDRYWSGLKCSSFVTDLIPTKKRKTTDLTEQPENYSDEGNASHIAFDVTDLEKQS